MVTYILSKKEFLLPSQWRQSLWRSLERVWTTSRNKSQLKETICLHNLLTKNPFLPWMSTGWTMRQTQLRNSMLWILWTRNLIIREVLKNWMTMGRPSLSSWGSLPGICCQGWARKGNMSFLFYFSISKLRKNKVLDQNKRTPSMTNYFHFYRLDYLFII